jgi:signal peptidase II
MTSSQSEAHPPAARKLSSTRRRQLTGGALLIAVVVVLIDQGTKVWAEATLTDRERIPLIGDLLGLQLAHNLGQHPLTIHLILFDRSSFPIS